jgi:spermidine/putrescine transport system permease protein
MSVAGPEAEARQRRWLSLPAVAVITLFGVLPLVIVVVYSLLRAAPYGGVEWTFSTDAYVSFLYQKDIFDDTLQFHADYLLIYGRSLAFSVITTLVCLVLGFPTAYFIATRPVATRQFWLLLVTIPFWSNLLIRTLAIMLLIRDDGLVNNGLMWLGVIDTPFVMIFTDFAIVLGLFYSFLPFMVLPLFSSLEKLDFRLVEAGFDLYANRFQVLTRIILPIARPGIVAGCLLVFIPCLGSYVTPLILGGGKHLMIGSLIAEQFGSARNWPMGAAQALILMAGVLVALWFYGRNAGRGAAHVR